jgi:hypothetical protein
MHQSSFGSVHSVLIDASTALQDRTIWVALIPHADVVAMQAFCRSVQAENGAQSAAADTQDSSEPMEAVPSSDGTHINQLPQSVLALIFHRLVGPDRHGAITNCSNAPYLHESYGMAYMPDRTGRSAIANKAALMHALERNRQPHCEVFRSPHYEAWRDLKHGTEELLNLTHVCQLWRHVVRTERVACHLAYVRPPFNFAMAVQTMSDDNDDAAAMDEGGWIPRYIHSRATPPTPVPSTNLESALLVDTKWSPFTLEGV